LLQEAVYDGRYSPGVSILNVDRVYRYNLVGGFRLVFDLFLDQETGKVFVSGVFYKAMVGRHDNIVTVL
jgi:hypothetical protein